MPPTEKRKYWKLGVELFRSIFNNKVILTLNRSINLAVKGSSDRPSNTGLSGSRWTMEANNLSLSGALKLAHGDEFLQKCKIFCVILRYFRETYKNSFLDVI